MFLRLILIAVFAPSMASAENWHGPYGGGGLTYAFGEAEVIGNRWAYDINAPETRVPHDLNGVGLTGFAGWNQRFGDLVLGTEARLTLGALASDVSIQGGRAIDEVTMAWRADAVGRIGYVTGSTMVYAGGGLSFVSISNLGGDIDAGALDLRDAHMRDEVRIGATFMVGAEMRLASGWILRGEISQTDFAPYQQANQQGAPGSQFYIVDNGPVQTVSLGVVFEF